MCKCCPWLACSTQSLCLRKTGVCYCTDSLPAAAGPYSVVLWWWFCYFGIDTVQAGQRTWIDLATVKTQIFWRVSVRTRNSCEPEVQIMTKWLIFCPSDPRKKNSCLGWSSTENSMPDTKCGNCSVVETASIPDWLLWSDRSLIKMTCISTEF